MEFLGGLELKPPQSTLFCMLSPDDVLEVARQHELARSCQLLADILLLSRYLSPGEARREGL
ncbi:hypothetical protein A2U01_0064698, partial [Trifolium medium]|nr:hypothetical protein [Trifolium medium]